jgi:transposase-like protein
MRRSSKSQRARLVAQWRGSGSSQAAFARRHQIHPRTFFDWIRACPAAPPAAAPFVPVHVVAASAVAPPDAAEGVTIVLPQGERLEVPAGASAAWVAAIVAGLRPAC